MSVSRSIFRRLAKVLASRHLYITTSLAFRGRGQALPANFDYVRYATLGLVYEEISGNKVPGSVAEVGVYKGEFAKRLNLLFSDRKLYLFDTFTGFTVDDISVDRENQFSSGSQDFSDTSLQQVKKKMPFPEQCVFKPGFFPGTVAEVEDSFCFVSLDADLFQPIYEGLRFFYPRLSKGGYIFIHDFNNEQYKGARQAVQQFCRENDIGYTPLPDGGGTAVICK